jgi:hypothetical protein
MSGAIHFMTAIALTLAVFSFVRPTTVVSPFGFASLPPDQELILWRRRNL